MAVDRPHLLIQNPGLRLEFASKARGGGGAVFPVVVNRRAGARRILGEVQAITAQMQAADFAADVLPMTLRATTQHGVSAAVPAPRRNDVLSVFGYDRAARVNVALDPSTFDSFAAAAERYVAWSDGRKPNHFNFFEAQPQIAATTVEDLWESPLKLPDLDEEFHWEVWLQPVAEPRFRQALENLRLQNPPRALEFADVRVLGLSATRRTFEELTRSASIAQLRPASTLNTGILRMPYGVQQAAVEAAARRVQPAAIEAPAVCLLDTGVRAANPLLANSVQFAGVAGGAYMPDDYNGHGTKMAGIALFADLPSLMTGGAVALSVNLESVAIEPPPGAAFPGSLPAARLREAVDLVERNHPRSRTFCLAMNATEESEDGSPSSLSSAVDALAAEVARPRLFCVAAGNLDGPNPRQGDYQNLNEITGIRSPAQAWNAVSVAACTELVTTPATHASVAPIGDLSPWSRTALNWQRRHKPPSKPDIVFEGGNQMIDRVSSAIGPHKDLCLLTTSNDPAAPLTLTAQTSAATAAIAGFCARLQAEYPRLWPETVRGLLVHASEYTAAMTARAQASARGGAAGSQHRALLGRYGYGRPNLEMAMENAKDALTLIVQGNLVPLRLNVAEKDAILGFMRFHALPWPMEVLEELEDVEAELRVTLSYFIEPNPGAVIKGDMDLYASHGLDFDVMRPDESQEQAIGRINGAKPAARRSTAPTLDWDFGKFRGRGGLRHDRLKVSAADLARMGGIAVFPRKGWWGKSHVEQQVRYSLIVSIRTPGEEIYTEIANEIAVLN